MHSVTCNRVSGREAGVPSLWLHYPVRCRGPEFSLLPFPCWLGVSHRLCSPLPSPVGLLAWLHSLVQSVLDPAKEQHSLLALDVWVAGTLEGSLDHLSRLLVHWKAGQY